MQNHSSLKAQDFSCFQTPPNNPTHSPTPMALETVVFKQDPFDITYNEIYKNWSFDECIEKEVPEGFYQGTGKEEEEPLPDSSSGDRTAAEGGDIPMMPITPSSSSRRKRRRTKSPKNEEDMENQRMTHIAVERNRRRQMNDYLSVLRSLMPPSYSQRGDQASIVGGAINFIKELEQQQQFLEAKQQILLNSKSDNIYSKLLKNFFTFPQYSTSLPNNIPNHYLHGIFSQQQPLQKLSKFADIEVSIAESHANVKILTTKGPTQLIVIVTGLHSLSLPILHLSITTAQQFVLYSFIVKVNDDSQLNSVDDIATAVHELVGMVKEGG